MASEAAPDTARKEQLGMSHALVVINLKISGELEPLVSAVDHLEAMIMDHFAPYVVVNKCSITTKNTYSRPDASESGPAMASLTEGHGSICPACIEGQCDAARGCKCREKL